MTSRPPWRSRDASRSAPPSLGYAKVFSNVFMSRNLLHNWFMLTKFTAHTKVLCQNKILHNSIVLVMMKRFCVVDFLGENRQRRAWPSSTAPRRSRGASGHEPRQVHRDARVDWSYSLQNLTDLHQFSSELTYTISQLGAALPGVRALISDKLHVRCVLGDIRLWVGDTATFLRLV